MVLHNMTHTKEHKTWSRIKKLCYNKNAKSYQSYGGRGIKVCDEWMDSFLKFYEDMGPMPDDCNGIELIDLNGDFCKINCRWVGPHNRRKLIEMPGNKLRTKKAQQVTVCIRLEKKYTEFLKRQAIEKSRQIGRVYSVSELIRDLLAKHAPMPRQMSFNEE